MTFIIDDIVNAVSNSVNAALSVFREVREQLGQVIERVSTLVVWLFDKFLGLVKFTFKEFPYDNYSRILILGIVVTLSIAFLLAVFGVASSAPFMLLNPSAAVRPYNPNAAKSSGDLTVGVGRDTLRERVGVRGSGLSFSNDSAARGSAELPGGPLACNDCNSNSGDLDGDGIPDQSDPDMDGDGIPNLQDADADGDGIPNEVDPNPCGAFAECPPSGNTTGGLRLCGNGVCERNVIAPMRKVSIDASEDRKSVV